VRGGVHQRADRKRQDQETPFPPISSPPPIVSSQVVNTVYEVMPGVLTEHGKTKNPYPNVDSHSGVLLKHYGFEHYDFYTVPCSSYNSLAFPGQPPGARPSTLHQTHTHMSSRACIPTPSRLCMVRCSRWIQTPLPPTPPLRACLLM
jgi:hypothetical protein